MFGLTPLGAVHTAISLVALVAGLLAIVKLRGIPLHGALGQTYFWATVLTCLTGFGIFQHGGFGKPHALGVITLLVLAAVVLADRNKLFGRLSPYVATIGLSLSYFFHWVPGVTETFTRLPAGAPVFTSPEDPGLQPVIGVLFVVFLIGSFLQVRRLRAQAAPGAAAMTA